MIIRNAVALALLAGTALATPAAAQTQTAPSGTPAFRVPLKDGPTDPGVPAVYTWLESISSCSTTCGTGTRTTSYSCQNVSTYNWQGGGYGAPSPASECTTAIGPAPADKTESCTVYTSCSYDWVAPSVTRTASAPGRVGCGTVRSQFDPYCRRSDGVVLAKGDHAMCSGDRPDYDAVAAGDPDALGYDRTATDLSNCAPADHQWKTGAWSAPSGTCTTNATRTRSVVCERKFDGATVDDAACGGGKPATSDTVSDYSSCSYSWKEGAWSAYSSTCSASATRTRSVTCERSNGDPVTDAECASAGTKPAASETSGQYSSCSYSAVNWGSPSFSSTCSTSATKTETAQCQRSDGTIVADSECTSRGTALSRTSTEANYTSCTNSWQTSAWSGPSNTCGPGSQTRAVWCERSNGDTVADASCTGTKPNATQPSTDYSTCGYSPGGTTTYGGWSLPCSATATRSVTRQCLRSDGSIVASSECTSRGVGLVSSETGPNYSGCGFTWQTGGWSGPSNTCGPGVQSRTVYCRRDDGTTSADAQCDAGTRPSSTQPSTDYSTCGYSAGGTTTYGGWGSNCSSNTSRSVTRQCVRSDGSVVASSECTSRGVTLVTSESGANYDGCGYSWQSGGWSSPSNTCGNGAQTRAVWCQRSDGTTVADSSCPAGTRPASSQGTADYSSCSYSAVGWTVSSWSSTCSASSTKYETATCRRSDGSDVAASECTNRGVALSRSSTEANYTGCGYTWQTGGWSGPSNTCGAGVQSRSVWCQRGDGATVADSNCGGGRPNSTQPSTDYSTCGYSAGGTPTYGGWNSGCSASAQRTVTLQCIRSDGAVVASSECTNRGVAVTSTETAANYSSCTYAPHDHGAGACDTNGQRPRYWDCTRSDGTTGFPASMCGKTNPTYESCGSYAWYAGGWSSPSNTCGAGSQTRTVFCRRNEDGAQVSDGLCGGGRPDASQPSTDYSSCSYSRGGITSYSDWNSHCSGSATRTAYHSCNRSDGASVATSECTNRGISVTTTDGPTGVYDGCGYTPTYGSYSACSGGTQSASMTGCTRSDGTGVATSMCTGAGHPATVSQSCTMPVADCRSVMISHGSSVAYTIARPLGGMNGTYDYAAPRPYFNGWYASVSPAFFDNGSFSKSGNVCRVEMGYGASCEVTVDASGNPTGPGFCINMVG